VLQGIRHQFVHDQPGHDGLVHVEACVGDFLDEADVPLGRAV
jgi:hypothetical protein